MDSKSINKIRKLCCLQQTSLEQTERVGCLCPCWHLIYCFPRAGRGGWSPPSSCHSKWGSATWRDRQTGLSVLLCCGQHLDSKGDGSIDQPRLADSPHAHTHAHYARTLAYSEYLIPTHQQWAATTEKKKKKKRNKFPGDPEKWSIWM